MIKLNSISLCMLMALALTACDRNETSSGSGSDAAILNAESTETTEEIVVEDDAEEDAETEASEAISEEVEREDVTEESEEEVVTTPSDEECVYGHYSFITAPDRKTHFRATLEEGGRIRYTLTGGPVRSWSRNGDDITFMQPFPRSDGSIKFEEEFTWTIQRESADCTVLRFGGKALDRATDMYAERQ